MEYIGMAIVAVFVLAAVTHMIVKWWVRDGDHDPIHGSWTKLENDKYDPLA